MRQPIGAFRLKEGASSREALSGRQKSPLAFCRQSTVCDRSLISQRQLLATGDGLSADDGSQLGRLPPVRTRATLGRLAPFRPVWLAVGEHSSLVRRVSLPLNGPWSTEPSLGALLARQSVLPCRKPSLPFPSSLPPCTTLFSATSIDGHRHKLICE